MKHGADLSDVATFVAESITNTCERLRGVCEDVGGPTLHYVSSEHGWSAHADVKPPSIEARFIRASGCSPIAALAALCAELDRFEHGERTGEP